MTPHKVSEASARLHKCRNNLLIRESRSEQIFKQTVKTSVGRCPKVVCGGFSQTLPRRWSSPPFFSSSFFFSFLRARAIVRKRRGWHYERETPLWQKLSSSHRGWEQYLVTRSGGVFLFRKKPRTPKSHFAVGTSGEEGIFRRRQRDPSPEVQRENFPTPPSSRREKIVSTRAVYMYREYVSSESFVSRAGNRWPEVSPSFPTLVSSIPLLPLFPRASPRKHASTGRDLSPRVSLTAELSSPRGANFLRAGEFSAPVGANASSVWRRWQPTGESRVPSRASRFFSRESWGWLAFVTRVERVDV